MQHATIDSPKIFGWEKFFADGKKDEPPIECRLAVSLSEDAIYSLIDFESDDFYLVPELFGFDIRRLYGEAGRDLFEHLETINGVPGDDQACCDRMWESFDRERVATDRLVIDTMDEAQSLGWEAPAEVLVEIIKLRDMQAARAAQRKAAEKAEEARYKVEVDAEDDADFAAYQKWIADGEPAYEPMTGLDHRERKRRFLDAAHRRTEQIEMRIAAEDERLAFGGSATAAQIDTWKEKHKRLMIPFERNLAPVTVLPFPAPAPPSATPPLSLTFFDECRDRAPKHWIFKGVFAKGENSSIFGAPGTLKSAFLTDIAVHAAAGKDWRKFKSKEKCGVVYFAFERADQVRRRLAAYTIRDGLKGLPIAVAGNIVDMLNPGCVDIVVATIRAAEARFGVPVGFIIFDTWSKGIAAGGGDEDQARDQNVIAANLRR